jgi:hypothetical protein
MLSENAIWLFGYLFWRVQTAPPICLFGIAQNEWANRFCYLFAYSGEQTQDFGLK